MFSVDDILLSNYSRMNESILNFTSDQVYSFLKKPEQGVCQSVLTALKSEKVDGKALLILNERDIYRLEHKYHLLLGDLKRFSLVVNKIQQENRNCLVYLGIIDNQNKLITNLVSQSPPNNSYHHAPSIFHQDSSVERISPANSVDGSNSGQYATCIQPEFFKTAVSISE